MNCGYGEKLILYFYGEADAALAAEVSAHLAGCPACRGELEALRAVSGRLAPEAPRPEVLASVMRTARALAGKRGRGPVFGWRELLLSGALASVLAGLFAVSGRPSRELAWNAGLDSRLDSVEYSVYQAQADFTASAGDWDYSYSELEDESLNVKDNV